MDSRDRDPRCQILDGKSALAIARVLALGAVPPPSLRAIRLFAIGPETAFAAGEGTLAQPELARIDGLFVVGSFSDLNAAGMVHFSKLAPFADSSQPASARGILVRLPSGMVAFTTHAGRSLGFTYSAERSIDGTLVKLKSPEAAFAILDAYQGCSPLDRERSLFWREPVEAVDEHGAARSAFAYVLNPDRTPSNARVIEDGDWRRSWAEKPPLIARLSDRQRNYLLKLSSSGARAIVPIDLKLYRELVAFELVVDKGRRLALTSLGQEVARFLS